MDMKRSIVALITSLAMNLTMIVACNLDATPWLWDEDATPVALPLELDLGDHQEARRWEAGPALRSLRPHETGLEVGFDVSATRGRYLARFLPIAADHLGSIEILTAEPESPIDVGVYIRSGLKPDYVVQAIPDNENPRRQLARFRVGRWQSHKVHGLRLSVGSDTPSLTIQRVTVSSERYEPVAHPRPDTDWERAFASEGPPRNLILIVADTLRADALSLFGSERTTSPALDLLARYGTAFESTSSQAPCTFPSVNSLLTSQPVSSFLGEPRREIRSLSGRGSIADRLRAVGFRTWAVSTSWVVRASESVHNDWGGGYDAGFDRFDEQCAAQRADCVNEVALGLLDDAPADGRPFFLYLHYLDTHDPYRPPAHFPRRFGVEEIGPDYVLRGDPNPLAATLYDGAGIEGIPEAEVQMLRDRYDDEIRFLDSEVHRLFEALRVRDLLAETMIVFTSDHGESFLDHGHLKHCRSVYEDQIRVPLVYWIPGSSSHRRRTDAVSLLDILPTALDYLSITVSEPLPAGRSLRPVIDRGQNHDQIAISTTVGFRSARNDRFKWIEDPSTDVGQLFDLALDANETIDVSAKHPAVVDQLAEALQTSSSADPADLEAARQHLEALGYLE
jgi:arylsulfatase A-like enzyme